MSQPIGARWSHAGRKSRHRARAVGTCSSHGNRERLIPPRRPTACSEQNGGDSTFFGWPDSPQVEAEIAAWFDAKALDEEKAVARRINKAALDHVVFAPLGFFLQHQAWRKNVSGIVQGPLPFFWGVSKTA